MEGSPGGSHVAEVDRELQTDLTRNTVFDVPKGGNFVLVVLGTSLGEQ